MNWKKLSILFFIPALSSCLVSPEMTTGIVNGKETPRILTRLDSSLNSSEDGSLFFRGEIISTGKSKITEKGFYWSTTSNNPGINDSIIESNVTDSVFAYQLKNALGDTIYYWRAYAKNSYGYDYGDVDSCRTPNVWTQRDYLNALARGRGAVFLVNNKIYVTCGELESARIPANSTWEDNLSISNSWIEIGDPFVVNSRIYPAIFTIGNFAFVGTGQKAFEVAYNDFYKFNTDNKVWTQITTDDAFNARYQSVAFGLNGKGYVVGGLLANGGVLNEVWQYDAAGGSWKRIKDFPNNFYGGISICNNNRAFVGFSESPESARTLWEYHDVSEDSTWTEFAQLPDSVTTKVYSGVIIQNNIYIVDGKNQIWTLNMSDKTWKKKAKLPLELLIGDNKESGWQNLLTTGNSNSIFVGLGFSKFLFEYRPLWDN